MTGTVRLLKINKRLEGKPVSTCVDALILGEDGAICEACDSPHHALCWNESDGCGNKGCVNAPPDMIPTVEEERLRSDEKRCPFCKKIIYIEADVCRHCNQIVSDDGNYHGPGTTVGEAKLSLYYGIGALLITCLAPICGPLAIKEGWQAKKRISRDVTLSGKGLATAGQIMGGLGLLFFVAALFSGELNPNALAYYIGYCMPPVLILLGIIALINLVRKRSSS